MSIRLVGRAEMHDQRPLERFFLLAVAAAAVLLLSCCGSSVDALHFQAQYEGIPADWKGKFLQGDLLYSPSEPIETFRMVITTRCDGKNLLSQLLWAIS